MRLGKIGDVPKSMTLYRSCDGCERRLSYSDERYEVKHFTFKDSKGLSQNIVGKFCPACFENLRIIKKV